MNDRRDPINEDEVLGLALARGLATDVMPERDLWPGIEAAIRGGREADRPERAALPGRRMTWFAQAAAVLMLVGASSGLTWLAMQDEAGPVAGGNGVEGLAFEPVSGSFGSRYTLGPDFQDARAALVTRLEAELERLPEETRLEVEQNLAVIRAAIADLNRALAEEPDNVLLQELLISTYGEELDIMRKVDGISTSVMRRTDI